MKILRTRSSSAFTLVEVLLAGTILAFTMFGVMGLLKVSDEMTYRAKADARAAQFVRERVGSLIGMPFSKIRDVVSEVAASDEGGYIWTFERGVLPVTEANSTSGFPFGEGLDLGDYSTPKYMLSSKSPDSPTEFREIFPYRERVLLDFPGVPSTSREASVTYVLEWTDQFSGADRSVSLTFTKYDNTYY